ncbi:class I SAM-dependent methyltransferase [Planctomonas sp. JC2975]|uniref:O-methyltransferase n=1 Tax=Planctomonas sp. JC2975 TaxID=2729626 RepID=UPI00197B4803|nr:class I SAM-dependent methyltransferase [Planctomonas sp. JC2975]
MDSELARVLDDLHDYGVRHDAAEADRLDRLRNVEPDTARLLAVLVRATHSTRILELGTSNGYSTLWLADAARATGGVVTSVELDAARSSEAAVNIQRAGLAEWVDLLVDDAGIVLMESKDASQDFIFLDAERRHYVGYWANLRRVLEPGGLLVVDNVLSHADQVEDFRLLVAADPGFSEALAPTGAGALLIVREPVPASGEEVVRS